MSSLINAGKIKRNKDQLLQQDMPYEMRFMDDSYYRKNIVCIYYKNCADLY